MSIEQLYDVCDICDVCDGLCDCVRCHTESPTDDNKIDTGTISKTTGSQYSLASKPTEINIITKSKPDNSYEDIIARATGKECLNNYSNSQNSTTNLETTIIRISTRITQAVKSLMLVSTQSLIVEQLRGISIMSSR